MLAAILALALYGGDPAATASSVPVRVCNAMQIDIDGVLFDAVRGASSAVVVALLKPGACTDVATIVPGDYTLRFIEHGPNGETAMCARPITVKPGDTVRISPDDGAQCVL